MVSWRGVLAARVSQECPWNPRSPLGIRTCPASPMAGISLANFSKCQAVSKPSDSIFPTAQGPTSIRCSWPKHSEASWGS